MRRGGLIGAGSSVPQAAASLGVSPNTVKTHVTRCFNKLGVHSQVALARLMASIPGSSRGAG